MSAFSIKTLIKYSLVAILAYFTIVFGIEAVRVLVFESERETLLRKQKIAAQDIIDSYTTLPHQSSHDTQTDQQLLFSLMLLEKNPEGLSQLEMLYHAYDLPMLFEPNEDFSRSLDLSSLYSEYRERLAGIGLDSPIIERTDLIEDSVDYELVKNYQGQYVQNILSISDFQMRDEESPFLLYPLKPYFPTSYYPANPHVPYIVEDALRTLESYELELGSSMDLALFTGDMTDNGHYNEVRWGIAAMNGGNIHPDSGADDDIFEGVYADGSPNDSSDPFDAKGFNQRPWYFVPGNHDGLAMGVFAMTYQPLDFRFVKLKQGTFGFMNDISIGDKNYLGSVPNVRSAFKYVLGQITGNTETRKVVADHARRLLNPVDIAKEMFITTGVPVGHGMQYVKDIEKDRSYSFVEQSPGSDIAIRHIALDTNALHLQGEFPDYKMTWLKKELEKAQKNNQLVVVSSHHKPKDIIGNGWNLVDLLNSYPNVIAHVVAHWHRNGLDVRPGDTPELGYWQIETGSMVNWPQQLRLLEVSIDQQAGIGMIETTMLNHHSDNPFAVSERGRFLAYLEARLKDGEKSLLKREGPVETRNTRLYFKLDKSLL